jgi:hypothetical protein
MRPARTLLREPVRVNPKLNFSPLLFCREAKEDCSSLVVVACARQKQHTSSSVSHQNFWCLVLLCYESVHSVVPTSPSSLFVSPHFRSTPIILLSLAATGNNNSKQLTHHEEGFATSQ